MYFKSTNFFGDLLVILIKNGEPLSFEEAKNFHEKTWLELSGFFETLLVKKTKAFDLDRHLKRIENSLIQMNYVCDLFLLKQEVENLLKSVASNRVYRLKLLITKSDRYLSLLDYMEQPTSYFQIYTKEIDFDYIFGHKSTNYFEYIEAKREAIQKKYDDVLFVDAGKILELSSSNIYFQLHNTSWVTPKSDKILPGIIRQKLIEKSIVKEKEIKIEELDSFISCARSNSLVLFEKIDKVNDVEFANEFDLEQMREFCLE